MYKTKENFSNDERRGNNARLYDDVAILDIAFDDLFYIEVSSKLEMFGEFLNKLIFKQNSVLNMKMINICGLCMKNHFCCDFFMC